MVAIVRHTLRLMKHGIGGLGYIDCWVENSAVTCLSVLGTFELIQDIYIGPLNSLRNCERGMCHQGVEIVRFPISWRGSVASCSLVASPGRASGSVQNPRKLMEKQLADACCYSSWTAMDRMA